MTLDLANLLVVLPNWVGDVVLSTPALRALRRSLPSSRITYLMKPYVQDVLHDCPWCDAIETWPDGGRWRSTWAAGRALRRGRYTAALLLTNSLRTALVARLSGAPHRIGYARDCRSALLTDRLTPLRNGRAFAIESMLTYYGRLVEYLGCASPEGGLELHRDAASERDIDAWWDGCGLGTGPVVLLNPGGRFGASKLYPAERFAAVGTTLMREDDARVVVTAGPGESAIVDAVVGAMPRPPIVIQPPRLNLRRLKSLIARSALLITNDTGPRHFAIALGTPVVTVFGPTHPGWTETHCPTERQVMVSVPCGPCQKPVCPLGHRECLTRITPDHVVAAARELLATAAAESR